MQVLLILEKFKETGELPEGIRIDGWVHEGMEEQVFVLKPAHTNAFPKTKYDVTWGGVCVNHSDEKGCSLSWENRPIMCQSLIATKEKKCFNTTWDKPQLIEEWREYQHYLERYTANVDFIQNEEYLPLAKLYQRKMEFDEMFKL